MVTILFRHSLAVGRAHEQCYRPVLPYTVLQHFGACCELFDWCFAGILLAISTGEAANTFMLSTLR